MTRRRGRKRKDTARHPGGEVVRERVGPTPETVAKLRRDPMVAAFGSERAPLFRAATDIREAFQWITMPVQVKCAALMEGAGGVGGEDPACVRRYLAWCDEMDRRRWPIGPVLDFVLEREPSLSKGVNRALGLYADMAGFAFG